LIWMMEKREGLEKEIRSFQGEKKKSRLLIPKSDFFPGGGEGSERLTSKRKEKKSLEKRAISFIS